MHPTSGDEILYIGDNVGIDPKQKPLVSVIIASHNRAKLLRAALASVYAQEGVGENFEMEVIVVDDGSTDATPEVVQQFSEIQYIRLETNRGLPVARNVGIRRSAGKYVAFLDDDDLWLPYKLTLQVPVLEAHPEIGVVYGQVIVKFGSNVFVRPEACKAPSGSVFRALLRESFLAPCSVLVRREAYERAGYFDEGLRSNVDYDMSLRLAFHFQIRFVPAPVAIYRISRQGTLLTAVAEERSNFRRVVEKALAMLPASTPDGSQMSREARARADLRIADLLEMTGDLKRMRSQLLKALEEFPWMATEAWARSWIACKVRRLALASDSPVTAVRAFCADAKAARGRRRLTERLGMRGLLAHVWMEAAIALGDNGSPRAGGYAAACAVLHDPTQLRRKIVLKHLGQAVLAIPRKFL